MDAKELIRKYLPKVNIMQLATSAENEPYLCTVHYYSDNDTNLYWCSLLSRRHSQEIKENDSVAAYALVHENTPNEDYVIGVTILGRAELIDPLVHEKTISAYAEKLDKGADFYQKVLNGEVPQKFYCLKPEKIILFDTKNFPDNPRQEILIK